MDSGQSPKLYQACPIQWSKQHKLTYLVGPWENWVKFCICNWQVNLSSWKPACLIDAKWCYIRQSTRPPSKPILGYCQLEPLEETSMKICVLTKCHWRKYIWKWLQNGNHFSSMCEAQWRNGILERWTVGEAFLLWSVAYSGHQHLMGHWNMKNAACPRRSMLLAIIRSL